MRINEDGIKFRNEVNLLNPLEMFIWLFGGDYFNGWIFKVDEIKIIDFGSFKKLNNLQIKRVKLFQKKYEDILPMGLNKLIKENI